MNANLNLYDPDALLCTAHVSKEDADNIQDYESPFALSRARLSGIKVHRTIDGEYHDTIHPTEKIDGAIIRAEIVDKQTGRGYVAIAHQGQWAIVGTIPRNNKINN